MNFSNYWMNLIMECVSFVQFSILVNGCPTKFFEPSRGLRQGDPIFPYLFLFCANILSLALSKEEGMGKFKGLQVGRRGVSFTHLLFADDTLFFFQNDKASVHSLRNTIQWYCSVSGQCINFHKSELFCSPNIPTSNKNPLLPSFK